MSPNPAYTKSLAVRGVEGDRVRRPRRRGRGGLFLRPVSSHPNPRCRRHPPIRSPPPKEDDHAARRIVGERPPRARRRTGRREALLPGRPIPLPRVAERRASGAYAAEEHRETPHRIVPECVVRTRSGGLIRRRLDRGPGRSIPLPGVGLERARPLSAEEDRHLALAVVGERVRVARVRRRAGEGLRPHGPVPLPRVLQRRVRLVEPPKRTVRPRAASNASAWAKRGSMPHKGIPVVSVPSPQIGIHS